jgi:hypothetical protein
MIRHLEAKFDATRGWFGWSDWDTLSSQLRGALNSEAQWQNCEIAAGMLTPYREGRFTHVYVDSEQSLSYGNLSMITVPFNAANGDLMILRQIDKGRRIEIAHSVFYMSTLGKANFTLDMAVKGYDLTIFMLMDGVWLEIVRHPLPSTTDHISAGLSYQKSDTVIAGATIDVDAALMHVTGPLSGSTFATWVIDVTVVLAGDGGPIEVWIQQPAGAGEYSIGSYTQIGSDSEADVEQGLVAAINALTSITGWSAFYVAGSANMEVYSPPSLGSDAKFLTLALANGTSSTINVTPMGGGAYGTEQDADVQYIGGLTTFGTCVLVNHNAFANIRFLTTGTIKTQGGTVLQPGQMATVLDQDGSTLVVLHEAQPEIVTVASADMLQIGTTPYQLLAACAADEAWGVEFHIKYFYGTAPYAIAGPSPAIRIVTTSGATFQQFTDNMIGGASARFVSRQLTGLMLLGEGFFLTTSNSNDPTGGDGTWEVEIRKVLHKF